MVLPLEASEMGWDRSASSSARTTTGLLGRLLLFLLLSFSFSLIVERAPTLLRLLLTRRVARKALKEAQKVR
jgi:hypothetical protein